MTADRPVRLEAPARQRDAPSGAKGVFVDYPLAAPSPRVRGEVKSWKQRTNVR
jgi:hypothetical protein